MARERQRERESERNHKHNSAEYIKDKTHEFGYSLQATRKISRTRTKKWKPEIETEKLLCLISANVEKSDQLEALKC